MSPRPDPLQVLLDAQNLVAPAVPADLVTTIFQIEERVQFDPDRREAPAKIRRAVQAVLDEESLSEVNE